MRSKIINKNFIKKEICQYYSIFLDKFLISGTMKKIQLGGILKNTIYFFAICVLLQNKRDQVKQYTNSVSQSLSVFVATFLPQRVTEPSGTATDTVGDLFRHK